LEEVNRRRQQSGKPAMSPPPVRPATLTQAPTPTVRRETYTRKPVVKTEKARVVRPVSRPAVVRSEVLEVVPVDLPTRAVTAEFVAPAVDIQSPPRPATTQVSARPTPPMLRQVLPFLRSRQTLQAAFVLHEILGQPRCRQQTRVMATLAQSHYHQ
jgi:hypothetical protein